MRFLKPFLVHKYNPENVVAMNEIEAMMDDQENWQDMSFTNGPLKHSKHLTGSYMNYLLGSVQEKRAHDLR